MTDLSSIPLGQIFADLQVSLTEIFLEELLDEPIDPHRLAGNKSIVAVIQAHFKNKYTRDDIEAFLNNGYPRRFTS